MITGVNNSKKKSDSRSQMKQNEKEKTYSWGRCCKYSLSSTRCINLEHIIEVISSVHRVV